MTDVVNGRIVEQFTGGSKKSFEGIFEDLYPPMLRYAKTFFQDAGESEDSVQEAFVELWNNRHKFEAYDQIRAFLYLTIKNKCLNEKKHLRVVEKYKEANTPDSEIDFDTATLRTELIYQLRAAIKKLPEQRKKIMLLSLRGLKNHEIADFLEISINTVKQQKKIAYKNLKESLGAKSLLFIHILIFSA